MLKFIGIGSAFNTAFGNTSAYYKKGLSMLLLDCGSNVFSRIRQGDLLQNIERAYVLVTHRHPDHIGSLGDLIFYCHYIAHVNISVLTADAVSLQQVLSFMGVRDELYELISLEGKYDIADSEMKVGLEPLKTAHSEGMNCYGYLMDIEGIRIFYSGDCREIREDVLGMLENGQLDILYQDTCSYDFPGNAHMSLDKLRLAVREELRNKVCCMHLDESFNMAAATELGFRVAKNENA